VCSKDYQILLVANLGRGDEVAAIPILRKERSVEGSNDLGTSSQALYESLSVRERETTSRDIGPDLGS